MDRVYSISTDSHSTATYNLEHLNDLLRGELSAVETYAEALKRIGSDWGSCTLEHIHARHHEAAEWLRHRVEQAGGQSAESAGLWGTFASLVMDAANLIGTATVLAALKHGEQVGINEYEETLRHEDIDPECREFLQHRLIPAGHHHILDLDHLLAQDPRV